MKNAAFTLIELLVVIAIIAVLMAILMPALQLAKDQAYGIICVSNLKTLSMSWYLYADDNDGKLVGGHPARTTPDDTWVKPPQGVGDVLQQEYNGIEAGRLWPYTKEFDVYRCPADRRKLQPPNFAFRSYSIAGGMNGEDKEWNGRAISRYSEIENPATKLVFVAECDPRSYNMGSWVVSHPPNNSWIDPLAIWHNKRSTLGWADGHAEKHRWVDDSTMHWAELAAIGQTDVFNKTPDSDEGEDLEFMQRSYQLKKN
jgi:prepilin-type N-terminal cleavage/methylation domain-containing protein/prepilin-type processing-associated H-X9-DG protein